MRLIRRRRGSTHPVSWEVARRGVHGFLYQPTFRDGRFRTVDSFPSLREAEAEWGFCDDGRGDLLGILEAVPVFEYLGLRGVSVGPVSEYPDNATDGPYAVSKHTAISPHSGNEPVVQILADEFERGGIMLWGDAPVCHTHPQHELFQHALADPLGPDGQMFTFFTEAERHLYENLTAVFADIQPTPYVYREDLGLYYVVRFYADQPALRGENPQVQEWVWGVLEHMFSRWRMHGVRLDAFMYAVSRPGTRGEHDSAALDALREYRARLDRHFPGRPLAVEVAGRRAVIAPYLQKGMAHLAWDFNFAAQCFWALVRQDARGLAEMLASTPPIDPDADFGIFLRQWDELQLLYEDEECRNDIFNVLGRGGQFRFNAGLTPRLAELVQDEDARQMLFGLLMCVPGVPFVYIGDLWGERGLQGRPERLDSRTATSWGPGRHADFSEAERIYAELSPDHQRNNVASQWGRKRSFLERSRRRIMMRNTLVPLQRGAWEEIWVSEPHVFAFVRTVEGSDGHRIDAICVFNVRRHPAVVEVDLSHWQTMRLIELQVDKPAFTGGGVEGDWHEVPWVSRGLHRMELDPYEMRILHPFRHDPTIL